MIDNRLKNCCNNCNHIDAFSDTTEEIGYRIEGCCIMQPNAVRVLIGCKHMYVCKAYIEESCKFCKYLEEKEDCAVCTNTRSDKFGNPVCNSDYCEEQEGRNRDD